MAGSNNRTLEQVRRDIESEREQLAGAAETLREEIGEATNIGAKLRSNLPVPPNPLHWSAVADRRLRRRSLAFGARLDQARLHLANEVGVLG